MDSPLPQREHTRLSADCLRLRTRCPYHLLAYSSQIDPPHQVHLPRVDFEDLDSRVEGGVGELYLPVDPAGPQQGRVKDVDSVSRHYDLDSLGGLEPVQLI